MKTLISNNHYIFDTVTLENRRKLFNASGTFKHLRTCPIKSLTYHSENSLVIRDEEGGWCLGDWCPLVEPMEIPIPYVNSCFFMKILEMLIELAPVAGHCEHIEEYRMLRDSIGQAIRQNYFDPETGHYARNIQGADAYALWVGLAGSEAAAKLARHYNELGHFDTGFLCTDVLAEVLCRYGHIDTLLKLLESEDMGSYLYMKRHGATTIWENWGRGNSEDHPMIGASVRQLFSSILGIGQSERSAGFAELRIAPQIPQDLPWASGRIRIPAGELAVTWKKDTDHVNFHIELPENTSARFIYGGQECILSQPVSDLTF